MKAGWTTRLISDICLVTDYVANGSFAALRENVSYLDEDGFAIVVRLTDSTKNWNGNYKYVSESAYHFLKKSALFPGDLVMSNVGEPGKVFVVPDLGKPMTLGPNSILIRPSTAHVSAQFLFHYFSSNDGRSKIDEISEGVAQKKFNKTAFRSLDLSIPPIEEQSRIVTLLDEAFADIATAKANAEKNLQNARELFSTQLQIVFGEPSKDWIKSTIDEHIRFIDYRGKTPNKTSQGLRLITAKNVKMGFIQKTPEEFVAPDSYDSWMTRGIPNKGDVLFTTEAPLANVAQLDTDEKVVFAQRIIIMQPNRQKLDPTFLKFLLLSPPIQQRIKDQGTGATVQGIKASLLKKIEISFPAALHLQTNIVVQLESLSEEVDRLESIYRQKLTALDDLKKSLLHQAFSGLL